MSYWSSQKIKKRISEVIVGECGVTVNQGSVELRMGPQAAVSCEGSPKKIKLEDGGELSIPEGQFALLLTEEVVKLPANTMAFISLKTGVKCQGLVNVSGVHVDPGFEGRLKFWVYNAGPKEIFVRRGEPTFLIWFSDFNERVNDPYRNKPEEQLTITAKNLNDMRGAVCSPSALGVKVAKLEERVGQLMTVTVTLVLTAVGLFVSLMLFALEILKDPGSPTDVRVEFADSRGIGLADPSALTSVTQQTEVASPAVEVAPSTEAVPPPALVPANIVPEIAPEPVPKAALEVTPPPIKEPPQP